MHRRKHFKKHFDKESLNDGIYICRLCHRGIHKLYDEMHLAKHLNSHELLAKDPKIAKHVEWVAKQK